MGLGVVDAVRPKLFGKKSTNDCRVRSAQGGRGGLEGGGGVGLGGMVLGCTHFAYEGSIVVFIVSAALELGFWALGFGGNHLRALYFISIGNLVAN